MRWWWWPTRASGGAPECRRPGCDHERAAHPSYVPGSGKPGFCGACRCYQYRPQQPWTRLLAWLRQSPAPVQADVIWQRPVPYPAREPAGYEDRTRLDIRIARPYAGTGDEGPLRVPRQRGKPR